MADLAHSVLAFRVGGAVFGIRLSDVKEIIQMPPTGITRAPTFPKSVLGIINVRGRIVPVINAWLCMDEKEPDSLDDAVVCLSEAGGEVAGFAVDELLNTVNGFDLYPTAGDDEGKNRLCAVEFREVDGVRTGLISARDIYDAARDVAGRGLGV